MGLLLEIDYEVSDKIVVAELRDLLKGMKYRKGQAMFSFDPKEEKEEIKKMQQALRLILDYYGWRETK